MWIHSCSCPNSVITSIKSIYLQVYLNLEQNISKSIIMNKWVYVLAKIMLFHRVYTKNLEIRNAKWGMIYHIILGSNGAASRKRGSITCLERIIACWCRRCIASATEQFHTVAWKQSWLTFLTTSLREGKRRFDSQKWPSWNYIINTCGVLVKTLAFQAGRPAGSILGRTSTQGLKITEEKEPSVNA
jgi:hypothetical protein